MQCKKLQPVDRRSSSLQPMSGEPNFRPAVRRMSSRDWIGISAFCWVEQLLCRARKGLEGPRICHHVADLKDKERRVGYVGYDPFLPSFLKSSATQDREEDN